MRSTSALLTGAAAALALILMPAVAFAQEDRAPAPPPSSGSGAPAPAAPAPTSSAGGQSSGYPSSGSGGAYQAPGWVDRSGSSGARIDPPSRFGGVGSGPGASGPPSRVELPAPRLDPPGGAIPRPVTPLPPGLMPRDPTPPVYSPPENIRVDLPGFVTRPGGGGSLGLPEDQPRLRAVEVLSDPGNRDDQRVLPPPDDGTEVTPPIDKRKPPEPKPPTPAEPGTPPNYPSSLGLLDRMGNWWYGYWGRDYWAEFGWWSRGCYMPYAMSEVDEYWARVTGWGYADSYGCGYGYGGYSTSRYHSYGYWVPLGWYGQVYGRGYRYGYGYGPGGMRFLTINAGACAVVRAETYSGRTYTIRLQLPAFGSSAWGPRGLRAEIMLRLDQDGAVTLQGSGSQELHLYDGFVKRLTTRWCGYDEF